jgi:hypothetical protein
MSQGLLALLREGQGGEVKGFRKTDDVQKKLKERERAQLGEGKDKEEKRRTGQALPESSQFSACEYI